MALLIVSARRRAEVLAKAVAAAAASVALLTICCLVAMVVVFGSVRFLGQCMCCDYLFLVSSVAIDTPRRLVDIHNDSFANVSGSG